MSEQIVVTGMVLTSMPVGDYDRRITILTTDRGKITAFARGARRPNSSLIAGTSPFAFGEFEVYQGKSAYNVTKVSIKNHFRELTQDIDSIYYGFYFLEFCEYFCQENAPEKMMLKLLYQSIRALESKKFHRDLVRIVFELKAMTFQGEGPEVTRCIKCRKTDELSWFSVKRGGCFCIVCQKQVDGVAISDSARFTMEYVVKAPVEKLFTFQVTDEVRRELKALMNQYMGHYVRHTFKSLQTIDEEFSQ